MKLSCQQIIEHIYQLPVISGEDINDFMVNLINRNISMSEFPEYLMNITSIGNHAFSNCTNLMLTSLPASVEIIYEEAFNKCTGLINLTFQGTPISIASNAFQNCTNLTTINVPWTEGAVANAPWGATNATINYNYTEE